MRAITSAHSMDTAFYVVDKDGYLYRCWSGEDGAIPENFGVGIDIGEDFDGIGYMQTSVKSLSDAFLNNEIDVCSNIYRYEIKTPSKLKVNDTYLKEHSLPVFDGDSFIVSSDYAKIHNRTPVASLITDLVIELTGGEVEQIKRFKNTLDRILKEHRFIDDAEEESVLFWGFRDLAPASVLLVLPHLFKERITWVDLSKIPVEYQLVEPIITRIKSIDDEVLELNNAFKKAVITFLEGARI